MASVAKVFPMCIPFCDSGGKLRVAVDAHLLGKSEADLGEYETPHRMKLGSKSPHYKVWENNGTSLGRPKQGFAVIHSSQTKAKVPDQHEMSPPPSGHPFLTGESIEKRTRISNSIVCGI